MSMALPASCFVLPGQGHPERCRSVRERNVRVRSVRTLDIETYIYNCVMVHAHSARLSRCLENILSNRGSRPRLGSITIRGLGLEARHHLRVHLLELLHDVCGRRASLLSHGCRSSNGAALEIFCTRLGCHLLRSDTFLFAEEATLGHRSADLGLGSGAAGQGSGATCSVLLDGDFGFAFCCLDLCCGLRGFFLCFRGLCGFLLPQKTASSLLLHRTSMCKGRLKSA